MCARLNAIVQQDGSRFPSYPFAGPQSFQYGNGQTFNQSRDQDYRPVTRADGPRTKSYSHDPAGNVASLTDPNNACSATPMTTPGG